jgi:hypothetical protein
MVPLVKAFLVAVALALLPLHAWAECAWVLWGDIIGQTWAIGSVYGSKRECEAAIRSEVRESALGKTLRMRGGEPDEVKIVHGVLCVPDTIDPRGAKGR